MEKKNLFVDSFPPNLSNNKLRKSYVQNGPKWLRCKSSFKCAGQVQKNAPVLEIEEEGIDFC